MCLLSKVVVERSEEGSLSQPRLRAKAVAKVGADGLVETIRRHEAAIDEPVTESRNVAADIKEIQHPVGKGLTHVIPIDIAQILGQTDQGVRGVIATRRQVWRCLGSR